MPNWEHTLAWAAQTATQATSTQQDAAAQQPPSFMLLMLGGIVVLILYQFLISRPQQKAQERKREEALSSLVKGDLVVTTAGIHGTVESVDKDKGTVNVTISPKVVVKFSRAAISSYTKKDKNATDETAA